MDVLRSIGVLVMTSIKILLRRFPVLKLLLKFTYLMVKLFLSCFDSKSVKPSPRPTFAIGSGLYHCFFGYYDKSPVSPCGRYVLYHKVRRLHLPGLKRLASICVYDSITQVNRRLARTSAWNWQQGAMLQWLPGNDEELVIIFNDLSTNGSTLCSRKVDIFGNELGSYEFPLGACRGDGQNILSIDFIALEAYKTGYGYPVISSMRGSVAASLSGHGRVIEISAEGGDCTELFCLDELNAFLISNGVLVLENSYINHPSYFPASSDFIFIHRTFSGQDDFISTLLLFDSSQGKFKILLGPGHISHFCWIGLTDLLIYGYDAARDCDGYFTLNVHNLTEVSKLEIQLYVDGHPTVSPNGKYIITDSYPDYARKQSLYIVDFQSSEVIKEFEFYSPIHYFDGSRCDLHPRWSYDGSMVLIDTTRSGFRKLEAFTLDELL